jgi:hypothetical protein
MEVCQAGVDGRNGGVSRHPPSSKDKASKRSSPAGLAFCEGGEVGADGRGGGFLVFGAVDTEVGEDVEGLLVSP